MDGEPEGLFVGFHLQVGVPLHGGPYAGPSVGDDAVKGKAPAVGHETYVAMGAVGAFALTLEVWPVLEWPTHIPL